MIQRIQIRNSATRDEQLFNRYLKPGALAQLRDSKLSARSRSRSQQYSLNTQISLTRFVTQQNNVSIIDNEGVCCFTRRLYGPSCFQRKRLVAAKSFFFSPFTPPRD